MEGARVVEVVAGAVDVVVVVEVDVEDDVNDGGRSEVVPSSPFPLAGVAVDGFGTATTRCLQAARSSAGEDEDLPPPINVTPSVKPTTAPRTRAKTTCNDLKAVS